MNNLDRVGDLARAKMALIDASNSIQQAMHHCEEAKAYLHDAGRDTQAVAIDMVCASLTQSKSDVNRWKEITQQTRENGNTHE